jgi:23S rRNA (guanine745-N1)-methyltransferase
LHGRFELVEEQGVQIPLALTAADAGALVGMGPNARHDRGRAAALKELDEPVAVTAAVRVACYRRM